MALFQMWPRAGFAERTEPSDAAGREQGHDTRRAGLSGRGSASGIGIIRGERHLRLSPSRSAKQSTQSEVTTTTKQEHPAARATAESHQFVAYTRCVLILNTPPRRSYYPSKRRGHDYGATALTIRKEQALYRVRSFAENRYANRISPPNTIQG